MPNDTTRLRGTSTTTVEDDVLGPMADHAVRTIFAVEEHTARHEVAFGRDNLVAVVNDIPPGEAHNHIDEYRRIIRENTWPNVVQPDVGDAAFITQFGLAAQAYVDTAFAAARWLETRDSRTLVKAHRGVLISEALRGQLGKSSPDGLDERLEQAIDQLVEYLDDEDDLYIVCAASSTMKPAEIAMVVDYYAMKAEFTSMPDMNMLVTLPASSATWLFFRRYCRWRFDRFGELWEQLSLLSMLEGDLIVADVDKVRFDLLATLPGPARQLADFVSALNVLNLSLEPTLSFKSGPGLLHAEVFRAAAHLAPTPVLRQLVLDRDDLLDHIQSINPIKESSA